MWLLSLAKKKAISGNLLGELNSSCVKPTYLAAGKLCK
jgi:hypothetical protein